MELGERGGAKTYEGQNESSWPVADAAMIALAASAASLQKRKTSGLGKPAAPRRRLGAVVAGALATTAVAAGVLVSTANPAWAATETLTLTPNHGQATDSFTAIYEVSPPPADCESGAELVNFYWDGGQGGRPGGDGRYGNGAQLLLSGDGRCRAFIQITPPSGYNRVGTHQLRGDRAPFVGPVTVYGTARAYYLIDDPPPSSDAADPGASPSQQQTSGGGGPVAIGNGAVVAPAASGVQGTPPAAIGNGAAVAAPAAPSVRGTPPVAPTDPLLAAGLRDAPALPGPGFAIAIPAARASPAVSAPGGRRHRNDGGNGWWIGIVGAATAVAAGSTVVVKRGRWSATRV